MHNQKNEKCLASLIVYQPLTIFDSPSQLLWSLSPILQQLPNIGGHDLLNDITLTLICVNDYYVDYIYNLIR